MCDSDIPVRMRKSQLGLKNEFQMVFNETDKKAGARFRNVAFPLMSQGLGGLLGKNRNALRVCGMIDNWNA